jgi:hypothetical protein
MRWLMLSKSMVTVTLSFFAASSFFESSLAF